MKKQTTARRGVKPDAAPEECGLSIHQELARTTQFKVCPHCSEPLQPHRDHPVERIHGAADLLGLSTTLDALSAEDERFVNTMAGQVRDFLRGVAGFFLTSAEIEKSAKHTLAEFKTFRQPTNLEEDMVLVSQIRNANAEWDVAKKHHEPVTSLFNAMHKRAVAWRKRPLDMLEEAATIGNRLHNAYDAEAKRKAREQEEAERRQAERDAQEQRDRELAAAEEAATKAEEASGDLSAREKYFTELMANGFNTPQASARMAGFKNPAKDGARLMGLVKIISAIDGLRKAAAIRQQARAVATAPLEVKTVEKVKPEVAGGSRKTVRAEVFDVDAFMAALLDPATRMRLSIPTELATFVQTKMNEQARTLGRNIERWPGVRYIEDRGVV